MRDVTSFYVKYDAISDAGLALQQSPALSDVTAHLRLIEQRPSCFHVGPGRPERERERERERGRERERENTVVLHESLKATLKGEWIVACHHREVMAPGYHKPLHSPQYRSIPAESQPRHLLEEGFIP